MIRVASSPLLGSLLAVVVSIPFPARAQTPQTPIVMQLPPTVRTAGFNGAGVALMGDAGSVFINPAGLATIRRIAVEVSYRPIENGTYPTEAEVLGGLTRMLHPRTSSDGEADRK